MCISLTDQWKEAGDRMEDAQKAYQGLISANVRTPTGPAWDEFRDQVIDAFDDPKFDSYNHTDDPAMVCIQNLYTCTGP